MPCYQFEKGLRTCSSNSTFNFQDISYKQKCGFPKGSPLSRIQFTVEEESDKIIRFLDVVTIRVGTNIRTNWHQKPTYSGTLRRVHFALVRIASMPPLVHNILFQPTIYIPIVQWYTSPLIRRLKVKVNSLC